MLIKKVSDVSGLVTTTILNTKTSEAEYKIMDNRSLLTTNVLTIKIGEVENKFLIMLNLLLFKNSII